MLATLHCQQDTKSACELRTGTLPVTWMSTGSLGVDHSEERLSTVASVLAPVRDTHLSQREVYLREPSVRLLAKLLGEVMSPHLEESESVIVDI